MYIPKRYGEQERSLPFRAYTFPVRPHTLVPMVINEIRRANTRALLASECQNSPAEFGRRIDRPDTQVNHLIGPNPTKNIGHKLARLIEMTFGKPHGWLDVQHQTELSPEALQIGRSYATLPPFRQQVVRELLASWNDAPPPEAALEHKDSRVETGGVSDGVGKGAIRRGSRAPRELSEPE